MPTVYKTLGQVEPAATTATTLYTVPASTATVCSTLSICNKGVSTTVRVAVRPAGETLEDKHYLAYGATVSANDSLFLTLGITLAATDVVTVYAGTADVSFGLFGSEIS
jgi:hypothetical protein